MSDESNFKSVPEVIAYLNDQREGDVRSARSIDFYLDVPVSLSEVLTSTYEGMGGSDTAPEGLENEMLGPGTYEAHVVLKIRRTGDAPMLPKTDGGFLN